MNKKLVLLVGSSCCGKTTLSNKIKNRQTNTLCLDHYFKEPNIIKKSFPIKFNGHIFGDWETLKSLNTDKFLDDIEKELKASHLTKDDDQTYLVVEGFALLELFPQLLERFTIDRICFMVGSSQQIVSNRYKKTSFGYLKHIWKVHCDRTLQFIKDWNATKKEKRVPFTIIKDRKWIEFDNQCFESESLNPKDLGICDFQLPPNPFELEQQQCLQQLQNSKEFDKSQDLVLGMLFCHALGDAYGAPYELSGKASPFSTNLDNVLCSKSQWQGKRFGVPGQATDDTAMTSLVLQALSYQKNWNKEEFKQQMIDLYGEWGASSPSGVGKNTKKLFCHNLKTLSKRRERYEQRFNDPSNDHQKNQSNGSLMRSCPFAMLQSLNEALELATIDTRLTNNNQVNEDCTRLYIILLHNLLNGKQPTLQHIDQWASQMTQAVKDVVENVLSDNPKRDLENGKGWVLNSLWAAFDGYRRLYESQGNISLHEFMGSIYILKNKNGKYLNTDSDTNAAIAGAIYGAWHGHLVLQQNDTNYKDDLKVLVTARYDLSVLKHGTGALQPFQYPQYVLKFKNASQKSKEKNLKKRKTLDNYLDNPKQVEKKVKN